MNAATETVSLNHLGERLRSPQGKKKWRQTGEGRQNLGYQTDLLYIFSALFKHAGARDLAGNRQLVNSRQFGQMAPNVSRWVRPGWIATAASIGRAFADDQQLICGMAPSAPAHAQRLSWQAQPTGKLLNRHLQADWILVATLKRPGACRFDAQD